MKKNYVGALFVNVLILTGTLLLTVAGNAQFITQWRTTTNNESITIPTTGSGYNYNVAWGDGTTSTGQTGDASHTYTTPGIHDVSITGAFPRIYFVGRGETRSKIIAISHWGTNAWPSMRQAFESCTNLNITATDTPVLRHLTVMRSIFYCCEKLNPTGASATAFNNWHTGLVTDMSGAFQRATTFNRDIGNWNTANVTNMEGMFQEAASFNKDIGNWNTGKVTNMRGMFLQAWAFNQNIGRWNIVSVTMMQDMFWEATSFNQNIGNWNTENLRDLSYMFARATSFNQDIGHWNTSKVYDMDGMFMDATAFNQNLGNWRIVDSVNMRDMFMNCALSVANYDQTLIGWAAQAPPAIEELGAEGLKYCAGAQARNKLLTVYGWTIVGDSLSCVAPPIPKVFPNPTTGLITIADTESGDVILLTNAIGQKLLTQIAKGASQTLNINFVAQGHYFISIFRGDRLVVTKKIEKLN